MQDSTLARFVPGRPPDLAVMMHLTISAISHRQQPRQGTTQSRLHADLSPAALTFS